MSTSSGGIVFISVSAASIGLFAACCAGYARQGLLVSWLLTAATLFDRHAAWARTLSPRPLANRVASVVDPAGLASLAVVGAILAVFGFSAGAVGRWGLERLRAGGRPRTDG